MKRPIPTDPRDVFTAIASEGGAYGRVLAAALASYDDSDRDADPLVTQAAVAKVTGLSSQTVRRALTEIADDGWLSPDAIYDGSRAIVVYRITWDTDSTEPYVPADVVADVERQIQAAHDASAGPVEVTDTEGGA